MPLATRSNHARSVPSNPSASCRGDDAHPSVEGGGVEAPPDLTLAADGAHELPDRPGRTLPPQDQRARQIGRRRSGRHGQPVDDHPAVGPHQHVGGMQVVVADAWPLVVIVVERVEHGHQLGPHGGIAHAQFEFGAQAGHQGRQATDHRAVALQLQRGKPPGEALHLVGTRPVATSNDGPSIRSRMTPPRPATVTVPWARATGSRRRPPSAHRGLEDRQAVPLGPVEFSA